MVCKYDLYRDHHHQGFSDAIFVHVAYPLARPLAPQLHIDKYWDGTIREPHNTIYFYIAASGFFPLRMGMGWPKDCPGGQGGWVLGGVIEPILMFLNKSTIEI